MNTIDTNVAWATLEKRADFLERMLEMRREQTNSRALKDGLMSSIPLLGEPLQFMSDIKHEGPMTAADRAAYIQYHPAHFAAGPLAMLLGAASSPLLAKYPGVRKLYQPINKILLGNGPHNIAPGVGIGVANTIGLGLLGNYGTRGALSYNYTKKHASFRFNIPDSEEQKKEKKIRALTGTAPVAPLLASRIYAMNAPLYDDISAIKGMNFDDAAQTLSRTNASLGAHNVAVAADRFKQIADDMAGGPLVPLGLQTPQQANKSIKATKDYGKIGLLVKQLMNIPGAYMDNDSPLAKALASNLYSDEEVKGLRGMIFGSQSNSPFRAFFLGGGSLEPKRPALHVLAHEMGHATQPKWMKSMPARMGLAGPLAAVAAPVLSDNEQISLAAAGLGTAAATPGLIGEYSASARGKNFLKQWVGNKTWSKLGPLAKLSPFVGLPTYLAAATVPWVAYGTKKYLGGFDDKNTK